jgi:hypothetical protein
MHVAALKHLQVLTLYLCQWTFYYCSISPFFTAPWEVRIYWPGSTLSHPQSSSVRLYLRHWTNYKVRKLGFIGKVYSVVSLPKLFPQRTVCAHLFLPRYYWRVQPYENPLSLLQVNNMRSSSQPMIPPPPLNFLHSSASSSRLVQIFYSPLRFPSTSLLPS